MPLFAASGTRAFVTEFTQRVLAHQAVTPRNAKAVWGGEFKFRGLGSHGANQDKETGRGGDKEIRQPPSPPCLRVSLSWYLKSTNYD